MLIDNGCGIHRIKPDPAAYTLRHSVNLQLCTSRATAAAPISNFYLLMPLALIALYLPGPPKALKIISGIGSVLGSLARF